MKFWKIIKDAKRGMKRRERRKKNNAKPQVLKSFIKIISREKNNQHGSRS